MCHNFVNDYLSTTVACFINFRILDLDDEDQPWNLPTLLTKVKLYHENHQF